MQPSHSTQDYETYAVEVFNMSGPEYQKTVLNIGTVCPKLILGTALDKKFEGASSTIFTSEATVEITPGEASPATPKMFVRTSPDRICSTPAAYQEMFATH